MMWARMKKGAGGMKVILTGVSAVTWHKWYMSPYVGGGPPSVITKGLPAHFGISSRSRAASNSKWPSEM
jgi:hypothetical protein